MQRSLFVGSIVVALGLGSLAGGCGSDPPSDGSDGGSSTSSSGGMWQDGGSSSSSSSSGADASVQDASDPDAATETDAATDAMVSDAATDAPEVRDAAPDGSLDAAASDDPFDASACSGPGITFAEAIAKLPSDASFVTLASYTLLARERTCNELGCSPWGEPHQAAAKHYGGNTTGGFALHGDFMLFVEDGLIDVVAMDDSIHEPGYTSLSFVSPTTSGTLVYPDATAYGYTAENNGFIPPLPVHDGWLATFPLTMTSSCAQIRSLEATPDGPATMQYALLVRF